MGWTMNDLRSGNRPVAPPGAAGPKTGQILNGRSNNPGRSEDRRPPGRRSGPAAVDHDDDNDEASGSDDGGVGDNSGAGHGGAGEDEPAGRHGSPLTFRVSRDVRSMPLSAGGHENSSQVNGAPAAPGLESSNRPQATNGRHGAAAARSPARRSTSTAAPSSRPAKRRDLVEEETEEPEEDKFPWHHQFQNDEPEELQAKSRLLSRAFRSSVG